MNQKNQKKLPSKYAFEAGIAFVFSGGIGYYFTGQYISSYETGWGSLARAFDSGAASTYQTLKFLNSFFSLVALGGIALLVYGFYLSSRDK